MTHIRTSRRWAAVALAAGLLAFAGRAEDEEPVAKKPAKKVVVDDDGPAAGNPLALPDPPIMAIYIHEIGKIDAEPQGAADTAPFFFFDMKCPGK